MTNKNTLKLEHRFTYVSLEPIENNVFTNNFGEKFVVLPLPEHCAFARSAVITYKKFRKI